MKKLLVILFSTFALAAVAQQQKIAVYVTAAEGIDEATKQIVGSELVTAITTNPDYNAVERTDELSLNSNKTCIFLSPDSRQE